MIWSFEESIKIFSQNFASESTAQKAYLLHSTVQLNTYTLYIMGAWYVIVFRGVL
jgi:hypothetical protein